MRAFVEADVRAELSAVKVGDRNNTLFSVLGDWAWGRKAGHSSAEAFTAAVEWQATALNTSFAKPLPDSEVQRMAMSVADGVWRWHGQGGARSVRYDHSPEAQRRRGRKSGLVRAGLVAGSNVNRTKELAKRDRAILNAYYGRNGPAQSKRSIAKAHGMTAWGVAKVIKRRHNDAALTTHRNAGVYPDALREQAQELTKRERDDAIRAEHKRSHLSTRELAKRMGVSKSVVHRAIAADSGVPN